MLEKRDQTRIAGETEFLKQVVVPGSDVGSLRNFSDVYPNEDFSFNVENSTNPDDIAATLVHHGRGGTSVGDAVVLAARWLAKQDSFGKQKMVFVFSDGDDDESHLFEHYPADWIAALAKLRIPVTVIAPSVVEHKKQGKSLKQFAAGTGSHAYFVPKSGDFDFSLLKRDLFR